MKPSRLTSGFLDASLATVWVSLNLLGPVTILHLLSWETDALPFLWFDLHFPSDLWCWVCFQVWARHLLTCRERSVSVLYQVLAFVLSCLCSLFLLLVCRGFHVFCVLTFYQIHYLKTNNRQINRSCFLHNLHNRKAWRYIVYYVEPAFLCRLGNWDLESYPQSHRCSELKIKSTTWIF